MKKSLAEIQQKFSTMGLGALPQQAVAKALYTAGYMPTITSESGMRATPENAIRYLQRIMQVDYDLRAKILDIRYMDQTDPRVKKIHARMARTAVKSGLLLKTNSTNKRLTRAWHDFERRLMLHRREKLESDARGLSMEGNLPMQWVLTPDSRVIRGVRMPTETLVPRVTEAGTFIDPARAYDQHNLYEGRVIASFALWQLSLARLTPDNFDDMGSMGRPYLDASRAVWQKLSMTEEDLVIRRKTRAPARRVHVLKNVDTETYETYKAARKADTYDMETDYVIKGDGDVKPVQGDASLDQIADVEYLLDTFFTGSPAPKGLFGYPKDLSRDILEDLKRDFFDEIDSLQDIQSFVYELGFRLDLLLQGINPDSYDFSIVFKERKTETPNQAFDRALKAQALGMSRETQIEIAGMDPAAERQRLEDELDGRNPYPNPYSDEPPARAPSVSITPGNQRKGESATDITTRSKA